MTENALPQEWTIRPERGSLALIKFGVKTALRLGRPRARLFLYPVCLYFLLSSAAARRASRAYLARALNRPPRISDIFHHFLTFAACLLDRVFLLNDRIGDYDINIQGEEILQRIEATGDGCLLFGAHFGSFEAARATGRRRADLPISLLMYEENAQKVRAALAAVNPLLAAEVIGLGRLDSMMIVADRLQRGHFIGLLADRHFDGKDLVRHDFLGAPAAFPSGPFQLALVLRRPVVMMFGISRGGNRYDLVFEDLTAALETRPADGEAWVAAAMRRYVERLEHYCREAPFNWFNFYDVWK
jgi:predicted LPLAT superfamily acyltransferase